MYGGVLLAHSWLRWLVLAGGLGLLGVAARGWRRDAGWTRGDRRWTSAFLRALDVQVLLGLLLYLVLSPTSRVGMGDLGVAMGDPTIRFYTVEHIFGMLLGVAIAHVGLARADRLERKARHRAVVRTQLLWLVVTLASIPWPFLPYGRPLLRLP